MKTVIIGIGNPILTDDAIGIKAVRAIKDHLMTGGFSEDDSRSRETDVLLQEVDVIELYAGGIRLMEAMRGYDRALVIDAMVTGNARPGTVHRPHIEETASTRNTVSVHDMDMATAVEMGKMLGIPLPSRICIWGIEASDVKTFSEEVTGDVSSAIPRVLAEVLDELEQPDPFVKRCSDRIKVHYCGPAHDGGRG